MRNPKCGYIGRTGETCNKIGTMTHVSHDEAIWFCADHFLNTREIKRTENQLSKESRELMWKRLNGEINSSQLYDAMYELHDKYPHAGFDKSADKVLQNIKQRQGVN